MTVRINPSILSADFVNMEHDLNLISNADFAHVDVMDNHFVPNLTFGPQMVQRIQDVSPVPLDVHLMISDCDRWAPQYAELGAASVTVHAEATSDPVALARRLKEIGARAGLALKPGTPFDDYREIAHHFDQLLVMTVEPGFGGQKFMADQMAKVRQVAEFRARTGVSLWIQVDGGIDSDTIQQAAESGADTFVAGSAVYGKDNPALAVENLRKIAQSHHHHHQE
ncbi:ribulose-phosphate 3-epimerase [Microbacteriaceae bacterium MWH-Ta3]|nr:ribulose-phosphate 3-epimerase [Microbacteriaceae bacterium MWH-Ta3]